MIPGLLAWALTTPSLDAQASEVQRYAVVIGANDGLSDDEPLLYAERDAARVADVLESLGDIRSEDIVSLRSVDSDRVRTALDDLGRRIERRKGASETLLFFYYSGHGDEEGLRLSDTSLPFDELTGMLQQLPVDVRVLVVDACQSGELTRIKGATPARPFEIQAEDRLDTEGMAIITSSAVGEDAQESDRLQGGVFTHHFVAGLMGAADDSGDQRITLTEAYTYGYAETVKSTSTARFVQRPSFGFKLSGRSDLVLTRVEDPGRNAVLAFRGSGQWLVFEGPGDGALVSEIAVDDQALLSVAPGQYLLRYRNDRSIREAEVDVRRGETLPVETRSMTPRSPGQTVRKGLVDDRAAFAWTIGAGVHGATAPEMPALVPQAYLGALIDFEPMSLAVRAGGSWTRRRHLENDQPVFTLTQTRIGADVAGIKKIDVGRFAFGLGVRTGADVFLQRFDAAGNAPPRTALVPRLGPVLSAEVPLGRTLLVFSGGTDVLWQRRYQGAEAPAPLTQVVVPTFSLELARHVR